MNKRKLFSMLLVLTVLLSCLGGCSNCEHRWEEANCKDPKTCKLCGETTGEPNEEHQWEDATTETPKTCSVCGLTEGDEIDVDERFTTKACKEVFGTWTGKYEQKGLQAGIGNIDYSAKLTLTFFNNGELQITTEPEDFSGVREDLEAKGYTFLTAEIQMVPDVLSAIDDPDAIKNMDKLLDMLEDNDDVQDVWHNWDRPDED